MDDDNEVEVVFDPDLAVNILNYVQKGSKNNRDVAVFHMMCCIVSLVEHREQAMLLLNLVYDFAEKFHKANEDSTGETIH